MILLLGWSAKAPPLPPPPVKTAGGPASTQMHFTNANHQVITVTSSIPPAPDLARPAAKSPGAANLAVNTNSPVDSVAEPAGQAPIHKQRIWFLAAIGTLTVALLLAILRKK